MLDPYLMDLSYRLAIASQAVRVLETETVDKRAPSALKHYRKQQAELERLIAIRKAELTGPSDVTVGLQSAVVSARRG